MKVIFQVNARFFNEDVIVSSLTWKNIRARSKQKKLFVEQRRGLAEVTSNRYFQIVD